jgi:proteasome accessory factor A
MRVFDRLIGLETEYAIRFRSPGPADRPSDYELYSAFVAALRQKLPTAEASVSQGQFKPGVFLANGGAVWFERYRQALECGLVEGCTPECRGPRQLVICQRAQDRLLAEAAGEVPGGQAFCLIKNCRDSKGHSYGAQENYEAVVARGWRLAVYRAGWVLIYPLVILLFVALGVVFGVLLAANGLIAGPVFGLICAIQKPTPERRREWQIRLFGRQWVTNDPLAAPYPSWLEGPLYILLKLLLVPLLLAVSALMAVTDLRRTQRRLLPFLISRAVLGGSGWLDARGRFHLAEKAESRLAIWNELIADGSRPLFNLGQFFKMLLALPPRWRDLMSARQRLQISLGDSNLCDEAEYLRVATTLLVLDAIEAGAITDAPWVWWPLRALWRISRDPTLTATVRVRGGRRMTALEIQRWYLEACRRFVAGRDDAPEEAHEVLRLWADVLDRLETDRESLVGRLDWVTKQYLLEKAGFGLPYAARKKIDLRYHELSAEGYHARLRAAGQVRALVGEEEVEQATRFPPASSPALRRAWYIREFSGTDTLLKVSWRVIEVIRNGKTETKIDLREP